MQLSKKSNQKLHRANPFNRSEVPSYGRYLREVQHNSKRTHAYIYIWNLWRDFKAHIRSYNTNSLGCRNRFVLQLDNMSGAGENGVQAKVSASVNSVRVAAYELVAMATVPGAVLALARLNVFEALAQAGEEAQLTASELAALAMPGKSINPTHLGRLLRMMSAKKVMREVVTMSRDGEVTERRYSLEPLGRLLVDDSENGSFLPLLQVQQYPEYLQALEHVHESVIDPTVDPFERAHGIPAWPYMKKHPEMGELINKAMVGFSKSCMPPVLDLYRGFSDVQELVDVGGGFGASLRLITAKYPHIKGINFDQPQVIAAAPPLPGVKHVGGNMFESVPSGGDAIFMKFILHCWDDEKCVKILKNCYQALPAHGKVIGVENILPQIIDFEGPDPLALQIDIHMMTWTDAGGRERTEHDMRKLGLAAGFKQVKVICKVDTLAVTEFHKA